MLPVGATIFEMHAAYKPAAVHLEDNICLRASHRLLLRPGQCELAALTLLEPGVVPLGLDLAEDRGIERRVRRLATRGGPIALFPHRLDQLLAVHRLTRFTQNLGSRVDRTHLLGRV